MFVVVVFAQHCPFCTYTLGTRILVSEFATYYIIIIIIIIIEQQLTVIKFSPVQTSLEALFHAALITQEVGAIILI